jgi:pimeloyl-ACP methyl ester carboxylesterase
VVQPPRRRVQRLALILLAVALGLTLSVPAALRHVRAAGILLRVVDLPDPTGLTAHVMGAVAEREERLELGHRVLRSRRYTPADPGPPTLLLHGVHPRGIDEPRLQRFARALAAAGLEVHTPELPELIDYDVVPTTMDDIAACARVVGEPRGRPVGAFGISFAGGLLLRAAARADSAGLFDYLVAVGAHHSLRRLATFYAGQPVRGPEGERAPGSPHPYGTRVIIRAHAGAFFDPADADVARHVLGLYLGERYRQAREEMAAMSPAGRALMEQVLDDAQRPEVSARLLRAVEANREALSAVSPAGKLAGLEVPTFLLHGRGDPVIPFVETLWLERELPARARREVLITPVLGHTDFSEKLPLVEYVRVVRFVAGILDAAGD